MALLFMDGFDTGSASKWVIAGTASFSTATRFGYSKYISGFDSASRLMTPASKLYIGFAVKFNNRADSMAPFIQLLGDGGLTSHLYFVHAPAGQLVVRLNDYGGTILGTCAISATDWQYIEIYAYIADSGGVVQVRINGQQLINFSGDTRNGGTASSISSIALRTSYANYCFDDLYICDDTGTANNTFLGDVRVQTLVPVSAGSSTQFSPTGGANYANVSENPDNTATYNTSSTTGNRDMYTMADLSASTAQIYGVQNSITAWKSDAGTGGLKTALKAGASVYYDTTQSPGTSASLYLSPVRETNPATSAAWTVSDVNNAELGMEVA